MKTERQEILARIRARLQQEGVDAYLAYTPPNNFYCSGYQSWFVSGHWRFHGGHLTLVSADPSIPLAVMVPEVEVLPARETTGFDDVHGFRMWLETRELGVITTPPPADTPPFHRTSWFEPSEQDAILRDILGDRGLLQARISTDLEHITLRSFDRYRALAPNVEWLDWTDELFALRAEKMPFEIDLLRRATELQDRAFAVVRDALRPGMTSADIRNAYTRAVLDAASGDARYADYMESWIIVAMGARAKISGPSPDGRLTPGDLVKLDGGVTVGGYKGDGGRTFAYQRVSDDARRLYDALLEANDRACATLRPGVPLSEAFLVCERYMHSHGYPQYCRGQFGHSIGIEQFPEEPPLIARDEHRLVRPNMVFAVETPYYGNDVGSIMIEDLVVTTESGIEPLHTSPRELVIIG